jgi:hypothetical protein
MTYLRICVSFIYLFFTKLYFFFFPRKCASKEISPQYIDHTIERHSTNPLLILNHQEQHIHGSRFKNKHKPRFYAIMRASTAIYFNTAPMWIIVPFSRKLI